MKVEFTETEYGLYMDFTPETPQEVGMLIRTINNAKKEPPDFYIDFATINGTPKAYMGVKKVELQKQSKSLSTNSNNRK